MAPPRPASRSSAARRRTPRDGDARVACLLVPELPLAATLRAHPELVGRPLAIASAAGPRGEIVALSTEAHRCGVRPRTSVVHGRAACAELEVRVASPALEGAARDALLDAALSTSPRAEPAPPARGPYAGEAAVLVDARGVDALFRSEPGFAGALAERAARVGLPAVVAVATAPEVARIAARRLADTPGSVQVIPPGGDAAFLAPLPLDLLNPEDALAEALTRFGLRRVGELTRLPERALVARLGRPVLRLLRLARGERRAPPPAAPARDGFEETVELEAPVEHLEPLLFVLRGMLSRLVARLSCRGLALGDLELDCRLDGGSHDARRVGLAAPTLDVSVALRLLDLSLAARPPSRAVERVRLATEGRSPRGDQLDFFRPSGPTPAALDRTLAELAALCGADRVGAPAVAELHRPDAFALERFRPQPRDPAPPPDPDAADARREPVLGLRALRPPLPAQVRAPRGVPEWIRSALANGEVLRCAGPWRTTGHWWCEERYAFDHYDVQTADGLVVRVRYDWVARRWEIDGLYD